MKELNVDNKVVPIYACPAAGERCLVYLLDLYLSKLPSIAFEKDVLYWKPKNDIPKSSKEPWYHCQPVGKHKLSGMVAWMCEEAGLSERKTNHSLCVTGATSLYKGGVPEREIQQRTGHCSIEALGKYECTGEEQHQAVSSMLSSPVEVPYSSHLVPVCCASTPSDPQQSSSVSLPHIRPPVLYHGPSVSSHSVRNQYSVQCPPGLNLQSLFQASGGGTLNINPHGNFVLNVQFGNRLQSEYDNCGAFDSLVKDANFEYCTTLNSTL